MHARRDAPNQIGFRLGHTEIDILRLRRYAPPAPRPTLRLAALVRALATVHRVPLVNGLQA